MLEIILAGMAAAVLTYELNTNRGYGPVAASASVGLFFGVISLAFGAAEIFEPGIAEAIPFAAMGASFAGMSSKKVIGSHAWISVSGAIFSFIFLFSSPVFRGLGGGLGISACIAVVATRGIAKLLKESGNKRTSKHYFFI